ncbi:MAG: hypothetical protein R3C56_15195 [Pirellulaceae bacterium]
MKNFQGVGPMQRRDFLKTGIQTTAVGAAGSIPAYASLVAAEACEDASPARASAVMGSYTAEDHRRRLQNIGLATREIRTCMRSTW